jgi:hypothetical protein
MSDFVSREICFDATASIIPGKHGASAEGMLVAEESLAVLPGMTDNRVKYNVI